MKRKIFIPFLIVSSLFVSCFEDADDNFPPAATIDIQNFIYRGLNYFYLYKADKPELANDAFAGQDALNDFLNNYETPETLFDYLKSPQDRFSGLYSD